MENILSFYSNYYFTIDINASLTCLLKIQVPINQDFIKKYYRLILQKDFNLFQMTIMDFFRFCFQTLDHSTKINQSNIFFMLIVFLNTF